LHLVFVTEGRWRETDDLLLRRMRTMLLAASQKKGHLLSRGAVLPDHIHLMMGCPLEESPAEVAASYMNNLAYLWGMRPIFMFSGFLGTFGEYDRGAIAE